MGKISVESLHAVMDAEGRGSGEIICCVRSLCRGAAGVSLHKHLQEAKSMKLRKIMQLCLILLMLSVSAYADDCIQAILDTPHLPRVSVDAEGNPVVGGELIYDYTPGERDVLTISPSGDAPGMYEIRIRGVRDSDKVEIRSVQASVRRYDNPCAEAVSKDAVCLCLSDTLVVEAQIRKGTTSGKSTYEKKLKVFLGEGSYYIVYFKLSEDGKEFFGRVVSEDSCEPLNGLHVTPKSPVNLSLQNATGEISGTDSFTLRNLGAELGSGEKFSAWGKFRWNPDTLSFELKDAGLQ